MSSHAPHLTPTEQRVFSLLLDGRSDPDIARCLGVSVGTVKAHLQHIRERFDTDRTGSQRFWVKCAYQLARAECEAEIAALRAKLPQTVP